MEETGDVVERSSTTMQCVKFLALDFARANRRGFVVTVVSGPWSKVAGKPVSVGAGQPRLVISAHRNTSPIACYTNEPL